MELTERARALHTVTDRGGPAVPKEEDLQDGEQYWAARRLVLYRGCNPGRVPPDKQGTRRVPPDPGDSWADEPTHADLRAWLAAAGRLREGSK